MKAARPGRRLTRLLIVGFAVNAIVFAAYTLPRLWQERGIAGRAATLREEVDRERRLVAALRDRADAVRANREDVERFYNEVLGSRRNTLPAALHEVESLARELGLRPDRRTYKHEDVKAAPLVRVVITMPLTGSYPQLVAFLDRLERSSAFLTVDKVELRGRPGSDEADLGVTLSAYFRAEAEAGRAS